MFDDGLGDVLGSHNLAGLNVSDGCGLMNDGGLGNGVGHGVQLGSHLMQDAY